MNTVNVYECIVADLGAGVPQSVIAEKYSVKRQTVNRIATGKQTMLRVPRAQRAAAPERAPGEMNKHHERAARRRCRVVRLADGVLLAGAADLDVARRVARVIGRDRCRVVIDGGAA